MKTKTIDVYIPMNSQDCPIERLREINKIHVYTNPVDDYPHNYKLKAKLVIEVPKISDTYDPLHLKIEQIIEKHIGEGPGGIYGASQAASDIVQLLNQGEQK